MKCVNVPTISFSEVRTTTCGLGFCWVLYGVWEFGSVRFLHVLTFVFGSVQFLVLAWFVLAGFGFFPISKCNAARSLMRTASFISLSAEQSAH